MSRCKWEEDEFFVLTRAKKWYEEGTLLKHDELHAEYLEAMIHAGYSLRPVHKWNEKYRNYQKLGYAVYRGDSTNCTQAK